MMTEEYLHALLHNMTIEEKIGQLTQYNANVFLDSSADITGPRMQLGLTDEDLSRVGSVLNFSSVAEVTGIVIAQEGICSFRNFAVFSSSRKRSNL